MWDPIPASVLACGKGIIVMKVGTAVLLLTVGDSTLTCIHYVVGGVSWPASV